MGSDTSYSLQDLAQPGPESGAQSPHYWGGAGGAPPPYDRPGEEPRALRLPLAGQNRARPLFWSRSPPRSAAPRCSTRSSRTASRTRTRRARAPPRRSRTRAASGRCPTSSCWSSRRAAARPRSRGPRPRPSGAWPRSRASRRAPATEARLRGRAGGAGGRLSSTRTPRTSPTVGEQGRGALRRRRGRHRRRRRRHRAPAERDDRGRPAPDRALSRRRCCSCSRCSSSAAWWRRRCRWSSGVLSIVTTLLLLRLLTNVMEIDVFVDQHRHRPRPGPGDRLQPVRRLAVPRGAGRRPSRPGPRCAATLGSTGRMVLFSGLTVGVAMVSLCVFPQRFLYSIGVGGALVALASVLVCLTVLPAMLAMLGPRVNALAPRGCRARRGEQRWYSLGRCGAAPSDPIATLVMAAMVLVGLPFLRVELTRADASVLPSGQQRPSGGRDPRRALRRRSGLGHRRGRCWTRAVRPGVGSGAAARAARAGADRRRRARASARAHRRRREARGRSAERRSVHRRGRRHGGHGAQARLGSARPGRRPSGRAHRPAREPRRPPAGRRSRSSSSRPCCCCSR